MSNIVNGFINSVAPSNGGGVLGFINERERVAATERMFDKQLGFNREDAAREYELRARDLGINELIAQTGVTQAGTNRFMAESERINNEAFNSNERFRLELGQQEQNRADRAQDFSHQSELEARQQQDAGAIYNALQNRFVAAGGSMTDVEGFREYARRDTRMMNTIAKLLPATQFARTAVSTATGFDPSKPVDLLRIEESPEHWVMTGANRETGKPGALTYDGKPASGSTPDNIAVLTDDDILSMLEVIALGGVADMTAIANAAPDAAPSSGSRITDAFVSMLNGVRNTPTGITAKQGLAAASPNMNPEVFDGVAGNAGGTQGSNAFQRTLATDKATTDNTIRQNAAESGNRIAEGRATFQMQNPNAALIAQNEARALTAGNTAATREDTNALIDKAIYDLTGNIDMSKRSRVWDQPFETVRTSDDPAVNRQMLSDDVRTTLNNPQNNAMLAEAGLPADRNAWTPEDYSKAVQLVLLSRRTDTIGVTDFIRPGANDTLGTITPQGLKAYLSGKSASAKRGIWE